MIRSLLRFAPLFMLMPDGGGSGCGMAQPMPATSPVAGAGTTQIKEKPYADDDFTPAALKWRAENGVSETMPTGTNHEPEGGGATAASASIPQGREEGDDIEKMRDELKPAPTHFSHVSGETEHDEDEARRANRRTGQPSDEEHSEVAQKPKPDQAAKPAPEAEQKQGKKELDK